MAEKIGLEFSVTSSGDSVITTIQKHLKELAKALQSTAKEMLSLQKTEAADTIGHVSMAVGQLSASLKKSGSEIKETTSLVKQMEKANAAFAKSSEHTRQAWAVLSQEIGNTKSFTVAKADANAYGTAIEKLINQMKALGYTESDLSSKVSYASSVEAQRAGQLQILGGRIRNVTEEGWKYLISNKQLRDSLRLLNDSASSYHTTMRKLESVSINPGNYIAAGKAARELGNQVQWSDKAFSQFAPNILKVEKNITQLAIAYKKATGETATWAKDIDRASIVNQNMANMLPGVTKHVELTAKGFKILSLEGLKPFVGLSLEVANNMGMLDSNFNKIQNSLRAFQVATGKSDDEIERLKNDLLATNNTFEKANTALKEYINSYSGMEAVQKKIAVLAIKYEDLLNATDRYGISAKNLFAQLQRQPNKLEEITQEIKNVNKQRNDEIALVKKNETAYKSLSAQYERLLTAQNQYGERARAVLEGLKEQGASASVTRSKLVALNNEMGNLDNWTNRLVRSFKTYAMYMISSSLLQGVTQSFNDGTAAIIEYDQTIQDLKAITEGTVREIGQMDDVLLKVASSSKFSTKETGEAMRQLGQAGLSASEIIGTIPGIVNLATGAAESLRTTVDLISTTMKVFGLDIDQTSRVTDIFANAVVKSRLKIEGLNTAFNYIGPVAKQAGLSLEETTAGLMMLANSGLKASTQATGFRQVLAELMTPSKAFSKAIIEAGYSLDDFSPLMNSFQTIMERLPNIITNSKDAMELFGIRGGAAVSAFVNQGAGELIRMTALLKEPGAAAQMSVIQMEGLGNILSNIKNKFEVLAITIGKAGFTGVLRSMALSLSEFLTTLEEFAQTVGGGLTLQIAGLAAGFTVLGTAISILLPIFKNIGSAFITFRTAIIGIISVLGGPLTFILAAVSAAIVGATYLWKKYTEESKKVIEEENKKIDSLKKVKESLDEYAKAFKTYGGKSKEASDALVDLNSKLEEYKKTSSKAKEFVESFSDSVEKSGKELKKTSEFISTLSNKIDNELNTSLINSVIAIEDLINKQNISTERWLRWKKFFGDNFIARNIGLIAKDYTNFFDGINSGLQYVVDKMLDLPKLMDNGLVEPFDNAIDAFNDYKDTASKGTEEQKNYFNQISVSAEELAKGILKGKDASKLTTSEITILAREFSRLNNLPQISEGGIVNYLTKMVDAAKLAAQQPAVIGSELAKVFSKIRDENSKIKLIDEESLKHKIDILDKGIAKVKETYTLELKAAEELRMSKLLDAAGSAEDIENVEKEHRETLLRLKSQENSAEIALMEEKQREFMIIYKTQLGYVEDYYKYQFAILENNNKSEEQANKDSLAKKLIDIVAYNKDAEKISKLSTESTIQFYKEELKIADEYYKQKSDLIKKEYDSRVLLAPLLRDTEKKTNSELKTLSEELVKNQTDNLITRKTKYIEVIDAMRSLEKSLTDKIKAEINLRKEHTASTEETIRNLRYKAMTDEKAQQEKLTYAMKLAVEARKLMQIGEFELAKKKSDEAKTALVDVANGIDKQSMSADKYSKTIEGIVTEIGNVNRTWDDASKGIVKTSKEQVDGVKSITSGAVYEVDKLNNSIIKVNTTFATLGVKKVEVDVKKALEDVRVLTSDWHSIQDKKVKIDAELDELKKSVAKANEELDGIKDREVTHKTNFTGAASSEKPLIEKLSEIKESIDNTFKFDESMTDILLTIRADGEGSPQVLSVVFESIITALTSIKQLLDDLASLPVELIITIKDNQALMDSIDRIGVALTELEKEWTSTLNLDVFGLNELQSAWSTWKGFIDSPPKIYREIIINEIHRTTEEKAIGGRAGNSKNHATGDRLPGYGGGDIIDARLEPGEWVIRKEAVKKYGDDFMAMVNGMNLAIPAFATGGSVSRRKDRILSYKKTPSSTIVPEGISETEQKDLLKKELALKAAEERTAAYKEAAEKIESDRIAKEKAEEEAAAKAVEEAALKGYLDGLTPEERAAYEYDQKALIDPVIAYEKANKAEKDRVAEEKASKDRIAKEAAEEKAKQIAADKEVAAAKAVEEAALKGYLDGLTPEERAAYEYEQKAKVDPTIAYEKANKAERDRIAKEKAEEEIAANAKAVEEAALKGYLDSLTTEERAAYEYEQKAKIDPATAYEKAARDQLNKSASSSASSSSGTSASSSSDSSSSLTAEELRNRPSNWKYFASGGKAEPVPAIVPDSKLPTTKRTSLSLNKTEIPTLEELISPYKSSNSIYDLFTAMNTIANIADFELTNMGMASVNNRSSNFNMNSPIHGPAPSIDGFYSSTLDDKPNLKELSFVRSAVFGAQATHFGGPTMATAGKYIVAIEKLLDAHKITDEDLIKRKAKKAENDRSKEIEGIIGGYSTGGSVKPGFATGGFVGSPSASSQIQRGAKPVTSPQGPSHTVNFNIGGEVHGPFSADGVTAESFIKTLRQHQMRS